MHEKGSILCTSVTSQTWNDSSWYIRRYVFNENRKIKFKKKNNLKSKKNVDSWGNVSSK